MAFAIFCFFEDVHALHVHLLDIRHRRKEGSMNLVAATVATSTALDLLWVSEGQMRPTLAGGGFHGRTLWFDLVHSDALMAAARTRIHQELPTIPRRRAKAVTSVCFLRSSTS